MSISPTGFSNLVAGPPLPPVHGASVDGTIQENVNQARRVLAQRQAEQADGIGETQPDQETSHGGASGRPPWEYPTRQAPGEETSDPSNTIRRDQSKLNVETDDERGSQLDLTG